jgi:putative RNA 2'-phosphotransferase
MLRECLEHGYFRGPKCPICGEEGKFIMDGEEVEKLSRTLSGILRHFPQHFSVQMDEHGWVDIEELAFATSKKRKQLHWVRPRHVIAIATTDPKGRYEIGDDKIRATYGHSFEVDLDRPIDNLPDKLYYSCSLEEEGVILESGIKPVGNRSMVHLSDSYEKAMEVGKIHIDSPVILNVDAKKALAEGTAIMRGGIGVYIAKEIPPEFIKKAKKRKG